MYPLESYDEIRLILAEKQTYEQLKISIEQKNHQIEGLTTEINEDALKIGIKPEIIKQYTFPFQLESDWKELLEKKQILELNEQNLLQRENKLTIDQQQVNDDKEKIKQQQLDDQEMLRLQEKLDQHLLAKQNKNIENKKHDDLQHMIRR